MKTEMSLTKFAEWAKSSLSQQTFSIYTLVYALVTPFHSATFYFWPHAPPPKKTRKNSMVMAQFTDSAHLH